MLAPPRSRAPGHVAVMYERQRASDEEVDNAHGRHENRKLAAYRGPERVQAESRQ